MVEYKTYSLDKAAFLKAYGCEIFLEPPVLGQRMSTFLAVGRKTVVDAALTAWNGPNPQVPIRDFLEARYSLKYACRRRREIKEQLQRRSALILSGKNRIIKK